MAAKSVEPKSTAAETEAQKLSATRSRDLEAAISTITKSFGDGAIMRLGAAGALRQVEVIPTGALSIDIALGVGGVPRGRVIEIYGPESSGKTTLMLHLIANAQKAGGVAAFIDAEHALDPGYAKKLGVDLDNLLVSQPDSGEEALTICETLARSNALDIIVVDSVAALVPKAELEGEMGMATMGMQVLPDVRIELSPQAQGQQANEAAHERAQHDRRQRPEDLGNLHGRRPSVRNARRREEMVDAAGIEPATPSV